jgi:hypothetical protein
MMNSTVNTRTAAWRDLFGTDSPPAKEVEYLSRIFESSAFGGESAGRSEGELVADIITACGEDIADGITEYYEDDGPTDLFYDALRAKLDQIIEYEQSDDSPIEAEGPDEDEAEGSDRFSPVDASPRMIGLDAVRMMIETGQLDLNPPWQRNVVWSPKKQKELIKSVLLGIPIPSIILHHENAGQLGNERYSIIDGKQRLTAVSNFLNNQFKLPKFDVDPAHPLYRARECYYDHPSEKRKSLPPEYRTKITNTQIPVLQFRDVPEKRLREVFNLYNVTAVRLNAAEIRNAVYQHNKIHRMLFVLAGENPDSPPLPFLDPGEGQRFADSLKRTLPNTNRFAVLSFLCRYLGYSRAVVPEGSSFTAVTTAVAINRYFESGSELESPEETAREIMEVFAIAQEFFDVDPDDEEAPMAFFRWKEKGKKGSRKFEALQAVTSMVCARVLRAALYEEATTREEIRQAVAVVVEREAYPDGQQYTTIWDYQARMVLGITDELNLDVSTLAQGWLGAFVERMTKARLPPSKKDASAETS